MNREIKFRGRMIDKRKWVYGDLVQDGNTKYIYCGTRRFKVIPKSIGQFTGKFDKENKRKVYEGDLYKIDWVIYEVKFVDNMFQLIKKTDYKSLNSKYIDGLSLDYIDSLGCEVMFIESF